MSTEHEQIAVEIDRQAFLAQTDKAIAEANAELKKTVQGSARNQELIDRIVVLTKNRAVGNA